MAPLSPQKSDFNKVTQRPGKGIDAPVDDEGHTLLHVAAKKGDILAIARLLRYGANPLQPDDAGQSPLFEAVAAHNIQAVKLLTDGNSGFRAEDDAGYTPLLWAIEKKADIAFIEQMRALGMRLDYQGNSGRGALHAAASANRPELVDYLLQNKAPIDAADKGGKTALHVAVETGAHDALRKLLERGANSQIRTREIKTPLYIAAAKGDGAAVDILLALPEVRNSINSYQSYAEGFTPLMAAVVGGHVAVAEKLINVGAYVNQKDNQNRHSLFIAVAMGTPAMVDMLIRHGADVEKGPRAAVNTQSMMHSINTAYYKETLTLLAAAGADMNATDSMGQTALYKAAELREAEKVKFLIELGANPDQPNIYGRRPIDAAVATYSTYFAAALETVTALLEAGASPNLLKTPAGAPTAPNVYYAPLHVAVRAGQVDMVKLLLEKGATVDEPDRINGMTPWLTAVSVRNTELCELLRLKGADTLKKDNQKRGVLHLAAESGAYELLEKALQLPALKGEVDTPDASGYTPLHSAARMNRTDSARMLLAAGANPLAYDTAGLTPLHQAARSYSDTMIRFFDTALGKKANWNIQSRNEKETPLHIAAKYGYQSSVEHLLKLDVNLVLKDNRGYTPLSAAIASEQTQTAKLLIDRLKLKKIALDDLVDNSGWSPLHIAARGWLPNGTALLLDAGANVNALTPEKETPLHVAVRHGRAEIARTLIQRGADVTLVNKTGSTALDLARDAANQELTDMLQQALKDQQKKPAPRPNRPSPPKP